MAICFAFARDVDTTSPPLFRRSTARLSETLLPGVTPPGVLLAVLDEPFACTGAGGGSGCDCCVGGVPVVGSAVGPGVGEPGVIFGRNQSASAVMPV